MGLIGVCRALWDFYARFLACRLCRGVVTCSISEVPQWLSRLQAFQLSKLTCQLPYTTAAVQTVYDCTAKMAGKLSEYKIPKLECSDSHLDGSRSKHVADWRVQQRAEFANIYANRCIYCKDFHRSNSYCFQIRLFNSSAIEMAGSSSKRKRRDSSSSSSSDSAAEDGELRSNDSGSGDSDNKESEHASDDEPDNLKDFYSKVERIDEKDVTLSLSKRSEKLYFSTVLGRGKFDREGREKIRDKYYLAPRQYTKFSPPDLMDTKLHIIESMDFSGLSQRLQMLHARLRDVAKVELKHFEALAISEKSIKGYDPVIVFEGDEAHDDFALADLQSYMAEPSSADDDVEFSQENFDTIKLQLDAYRRKDSDTVRQYRRVLNKLEDADKAAREGKKLQDLSSELVWDELQLTGQADVFLR